MKKIYKIIAILFLLPAVMACKDSFPVITDADGNPIDAPGMAYIISENLPADIGINITTADGRHHYKASAGIPFNIEAGNWQAIAYTNAAALGETSAGVINIPVGPDGKVSQPEFSAGVTSFIVTENKRVDVQLTVFQPMTRRLAVPFNTQDIETGKINSIILRLKHAVVAVNVSKGFGHTAGTDPNSFVEAEGIFTVPAQLVGRANGVMVFTLPAAPLEVNGFVEAELSIDISNVGLYVQPIAIPGFEGTFNAGSVATDYFTDIINVHLTPGGVETEIKPWEKEPGIEIPGI